MTEREGMNWDAARFEHALKEATREAFLALKRTRREALVLSLLLSDMSYEQQLEWARRLKPESVTNRLECELAAATEVVMRRQLELARSTRETLELMNETPPGRE